MALPGTTVPGTPLGAMMGAMIVVFILIALAFYIYAALALMFIAKKTKTKNGWFAFIPILNIYLMTQMAKIPAWWTLVIILPFIPFVGGLAMGAAMIYFWWKIAERIHRPGWWGILMILPIVNLVILGIMAWGK
jgi:hypothetical protein